MSVKRKSQNNEVTGSKWTMLTSFVSNIDLQNHAKGPKDQPARAFVVVSGGVLVLVKPDGDTETTPTLPAGFQLNGQAQQITALGTTATAVIVYW